MRNVTRALVGAIVASLVAATVSVHAQTPTEAEFAACNTGARAATKAGTATPTTKDYMRVESALKDSAATWTTGVRPIRMESADPQLIGMATDGITDAAYQATYRTCMRRKGF
jgi:cell division protein FtsI/penicillin-binding protein 2